MHQYIISILDSCPTLRAWNGKNSRSIPTSNRLIIDYRELGINGRLNSVTLKQIALYDGDRLETILKQGYQFLYQGRDYTLQANGKKLILTVSRGEQVDLQKPNLTATMVKELLRDGVINKDITDVLSELIEKGIRG